jgi:acetyl-CoA decarbonylase/synthase complex subunit beta
VDGFGYVHRDFQGEICNGRTFSSMAGEAAGGKQIEGLIGSAIDYLRSKKFLIGDGGLNRIVWLPKEIKEDLKEDIPEELYPKISSEEDATNVEDLMEFLEQQGHPCLT